MKEKIMLKSAVHSKESLLVALLLAMNTGFVDAFTFFHFDGRFASLQTGNLIQTGINLAHGNLEKAFQFIIPILFFALGALFKTLFTKYKTQNNQSEIESLLFIQMIGILLISLAFATFLHLSASLFVGILSFFMVIQDDTFTRVRGLPYANIMSTGNIKAFGTNLGQYLVSKNTKDLKNSLIFLSLALSFVVGAFISSLLSLWLGDFTLIGSSLLILLAYYSYKISHS
ncbi:YoaK family protein [Lactococcus lactis]|uniref:YoaK family protein n=1 Tax=Lactococcus lactis TaxID=1358 RepID=UPI00321A0F6C